MKICLAVFFRCDARIFETLVIEGVLIRALKASLGAKIPISDLPYPFFIFLGDNSVTVWPYVQKILGYDELVPDEGEIADTQAETQAVTAVVTQEAASENAELAT